MSGNASTAAIILAAGEASRMGQPKQLLPIDHTTLIQQAIATVLAAACVPVIVVLGAHGDLIKDTIQHDIAELTMNEQWQEGMSSSIRAGISKLSAISPESEAAIILLCDQPLVTPALLHKLIDTHIQENKPIIASRYKESLGVPALFYRSFFDQLMNLKGKGGAKQLISQHPDQTVAIPFEEGAIDLDTPEDYENFLKFKQKRKY